MGPLVLDFCQEKAIQHTAVGVTVMEAVRTPERQRELVTQRASQTQNGYYLKQADRYGHSVD